MTKTTNDPILGECGEVADGIRVELARLMGRLDTELPWRRALILAELEAIAARLARMARPITPTPYPTH